MDLFPGRHFQQGNGHFPLNVNSTFFLLLESTAIWMSRGCWYLDENFDVVRFVKLYTIQTLI